MAEKQICNLAAGKSINFLSFKSSGSFFQRSGIERDEALQLAVAVQAALFFPPLQEGEGSALQPGVFR